MLFDRPDPPQASNTRLTASPAPRNTVDSRSAFDPIGHSQTTSANNSFVNSVQDTSQFANNIDQHFEYSSPSLNRSNAPTFAHHDQSSHQPQIIYEQFSTMAQGQYTGRSLLCRPSSLTLPPDSDKTAMEETLNFKDLLGGGDFGSLNPNSFNPINEQGTSNASNPTISPHDIFMDHSAPNSNALTNLTTPSMYDGSPDDLDSFEASPLFIDSNNIGHSQWPSLFENDNGLYAPAEINSSTESLEHTTSGVSLAAVTMDRTISMSSSHSAPKSIERTDPKHRLSLTSGVTKNRRTGRTLAPIEVEEGDSKALKRAKNTMAARKSRQKKRDIEESLRGELAEMTAERDRWMHIAIKYGAPLPDTRAPSRNADKEDA